MHTFISEFTVIESKDLINVEEFHSKTIYVLQKYSTNLFLLHSQENLFPFHKQLSMYNFTLSICHNANKIVKYSKKQRK